MVGMVMAYFLIAYHGVGSGHLRPKQSGKAA